jgi:hypothetical protein
LAVGNRCPIPLSGLAVPKRVVIVVGEGVIGEAISASWFVDLVVGDCKLMFGLVPQRPDRGDVLDGGVTS